MNSILYYFNCSRKEYIELGVKYYYSLRVDDIMWLLDNQTNREIRTPYISYNEERFMVKVRFTGENNEWIEIYFQPESALISYYMKIKSTNCCINKEKEWIPKKMWHLCIIQSKDTIKKTGRNNMFLNFEFLVHHSSNSDFPKVLSCPQEFEVSVPNDHFNDLKSLMTNIDFSDVTIKSADGYEFPAHKCVLAIRSPVFKANFKQNAVENAKNVVETTFGTNVLKNVLSYIYTDNAPMAFIMPRDLLEAADFYQLNGLKRISETLLEENLTINNAIETLELANMYRAMYLRRKPLEFIRDGLTGEITLTEGWKTLQSAEIIKSIYEFVLVK